MLAVFRRELPALADAEILVTDCSARTSRSRRSIREGKLEVVYRVGIEASGGHRSEHVLFGIAPAAPELLDSELQNQRHILRGHPWAKPFRELSLYIGDLRLALLFFPLDPELPGLAEITGSEGARLLAEWLPECRAGAQIERIDCSLAHYKPFKRAVLKIRAAFRGPKAHERNVYAKFYSDERGATCFENLSALWPAMQGATSLRLPEPLGFDVQRRMVVMSEAPGQRSLTEWVKSVERGEPLPAGVDLARLKACALVAAQSLFELQRSGVHPEQRAGFEDELARVRKDCDLLLEAVRKKQPELAACADSLLRRLEALTPRNERLVPAHGGFRHDQMIGDERALTLVDWDGFSLANPVLDAATFLARLRREPRRRPGSAPELEQMAATFRGAFLEGQPELARDIELYESLQVTEQMLRAFRRPGDPEETALEIRLLAAAAAELLDRVEGTTRLEGLGVVNGSPIGDRLGFDARDGALERLNGATPGEDRGASRGSGSKGVPLSTAPQHRDLFGIVADHELMLAVFRRELPALADGEIRVIGCKAKPSKSRKSIRQGRLDIVYKVKIEVGEQTRELMLLGVAPAPPELLGSDMMQRCRGLRGHPWATPFRELATYVEELRMALLLFPMDPALPGLAEATGSEAARLLAALLPECRAGAEIVGLECDLIRYKPFGRAVVRMRSPLRGPPAGEGRRTTYAKFFADDEGAAHFRNLKALWSAARDATCLRLPEPLGYDPDRRMLVMSEVPGNRDLTRWIKCIERGEPLPAGTDPACLERCARIVARALHELQASGVRPELRRTFRHELARVRVDSGLLLDNVRKQQPELTAGADALIERLETLAPAEEPLVPAHGCYRHKQMIGDEHSLTFIDWDGFSLANPALDAATFLGRLCREPRRRPGSAALLEHLGATFRTTFLENRPELARDLALYEGLVLTEQMLRAFRRPGDGAETVCEIRFLADAAAGMLDQVEGAPTLG